MNPSKRAPKKSITKTLKNHSLQKEGNFRPVKLNRNSKEKSNPKRSMPKEIVSDSWGPVSDKYHNHLEGVSTYHKDIIYPNIIKYLEAGDKVLDIGCGEGQFGRYLYDKNIEYTGIDIGKQLIGIATEKVKSLKKNNAKLPVYLSASSNDMYMLKTGTYDKVTCILALQNMKDLDGMLREANRVIKREGVMYLVINHPCFRVPQKSSWGYSESEQIEYRRVDGYLHEYNVKMDMNPGSARNKVFTVSYHRALQILFKSFAKNGFGVSKIEEWESKKVSNGKRALAENKRRKEIPLFMFLELKKWQ